MHGNNSSHILSEYVILEIYNCCEQNIERNLDNFVRSDQNGIDVKIISMERFRLGAWGKQSMEIFGVEGISGGGSRWMTSKEGNLS